MSQPIPSPGELLEIAQEAIPRGNFAFAEILCRMVLNVAPENALAKQIIDWIARQLGLGEPLPASPGEKLLLIKAWGSGFWSDVDHVLGGLLLAEVSGRTPVVHWGAGSLFSDDPTQNAFEQFFLPVSRFTIDDLARPGWTYFPPKWTVGNFRSDNVDKWRGEFSHVAGIYLLNRPETVAIADFFLPILCLAPWIRPGHRLYGTSIHQIYRDLIARYLRPVAAVQKQIDQFYGRHLAGRPFIAAHVRGSDKHSELAGLDEINASYFEYIDALALDKSWQVFLLTDSQPVTDAFRARYQDRLVLTESERTNDRTGVHNKPTAQKGRRGFEVLVDTYIAARADRFIGNGASNVSCMVEHLKDWREGDCRLLLPNIHYVFDAMLHQW